MSNDRYPLRQIILDDLTSHNKVALLLLLLVIASAIATVWVTHKTRIFTAEQSKLIQANHKLQNQFYHLRLEETSSKKDEDVYKLGLQEIKKEQEIILVR
ncbi:cell division protein FtsL [Ursidibacter arcticus]|uniref:cell division protein FtsL n=1 Tax=Ursidibacter arcticus TaxID=1524965 RepID=UPI003B83540B